MSIILGVLGPAGSLSVMLARGIRRAQPLLFSLRWFLNIDEAPFRSVGVIAAALTFVIVGISRVL